MVQVVLFSNRGNGGLKYFPYHGLLGLTPVRVEGVVRTKLDSDLKPVAAKSLTVSVRCYETRLGRLGSVQSMKCLVEHSQVLWSSSKTERRPSTAPSPGASSSPAYTDLGEFEAAFRITLPVNVGGHSTVTFPDYRVCWKVEAVLEHVSIPGVGQRQIKQFELPFIRHDVPVPLFRPLGPTSPLSPSPASSSSSLPLSNFHTVYKGRFPLFHYSLGVPSDSVGPEDFVSVPLIIRPLDPGFAVKSATMAIERRMAFSSAGAGSATPPPQEQDHLFFPSDNTSGSLTPTPSTLSQATFIPLDVGSAMASTASMLPTPPSLYSALSDTSLTSTIVGPTPAVPFPLSGRTPPASSPSPAPSPSTSRSYSTVATSLVASTEVSGGLFTRETALSSSRASLHDPDTWSKTLTVRWPSAPSNARWSIGETLRTDSASLRFIVCVRIVASLSSGVETFDLDVGEDVERELLVVGINAAQRSVLLGKFNDAQVSKKSKSQSPRRRTRGETVPTSQLPSPPNSPPQDPHRGGSLPTEGLQSSSSRGDGHTYGPAPPPSAPPLMAASSAMPILTMGRKKASNSVPRAARAPRRPHTSAGPRDVPLSGPPGATSPYGTRGLNGDARYPSAAIQPSGPALGDGDVQDWEAELARIELRSRRSSANMLGVRDRREG